ncbi:hypothetical protein VNO80_25455 [Phaseolus coccineus]|uniref:Reverse transcriptase zinc-binding domain-containing protein n=1 Tax=Phaseolus coccineus TaxID=3886 RepID=A0AAN9QLY8_PHACN
MEWRCRRFEWETEQIDSLKQELDETQLELEGEYGWQWMADETLTYIVKLAYNKLINVVVGEEKGLHEVFCKIKVLPSTHLLAWQVLKNRVATKDKLAHQVVILDNLSWVMCGKVEESVSYLFLTCEVTSVVWNL